MKSQAQVVVIGGGVVGASVLYHLTKAGWADVVLVERTELTAGSTWHSAGGMHTLNGDPNVARLQRYTTELYAEIERVSGQDCGIHMPGGVMLADTPERLDWLKMTHARGRCLGMETELVSVAEAAELVPLFDPKYFVGALVDAHEGHVDPAGVTHAYAKAARAAGAEVYRNIWARAIERGRDGGWRVLVYDTAGGDDLGAIDCEHVVNCGGLWAREVGRMVGLELPVLAMEHTYLVTEPRRVRTPAEAAAGVVAAASAQDPRRPPSDIHGRAEADVQDLVLPEPAIRVLDSLAEEFRQRSALRAHGVAPRSSLLLVGPPRLWQVGQRRGDGRTSRPSHSTRSTGHGRLVALGRDGSEPRSDLQLPGRGIVVADL